MLLMLVLLVVDIDIPFMDILSFVTLYKQNKETINTNLMEIPVPSSLRVPSLLPTIDPAPLLVFRLFRFSAVTFFVGIMISNFSIQFNSIQSSDLFIL